MPGLDSMLRSADAVDAHRIAVERHGNPIRIEFDRSNTDGGEHAWGRDWGWDATEVWSVVIWVVYAADLPARSTRGWEGRRAAWFSVAGFASILVNYYVVNLFVNSLHSYSGV